MRNYFVYNSMDSRTYGVYISGSGIFDSPARNMNFISVPGRNGDLIGHEKRFENINLTYPAFICADFKNKIQSFRSAMQSVQSYARLTDSYHTDEFRLAAFVGGVDVSPASMLQAGKFDITFNCKPQRFLTSGETETTFNASGTISNPTSFPSKPKITVTGYGTLTINGSNITIANAYPSVIIDSDICDCYYGTTNANGQVSFASNDFPELIPGSNTIAFSGNITQVKVLPRWWRI